MLKRTCNLQVVAEVFAAQDVGVRPHVLLSLVLYKIADPHQVHYNFADMRVTRELPLFSLFQACKTTHSLMQLCPHQV